VNTENFLAGDRLRECAVSVELRAKDECDGVEGWNKASVLVNLAKFLQLYRL
jgi:hypothetical protein